MKHKILVIDDDEAMRWLLKKMLDHEYNVEVFSHVGNAIKHMNMNGQPDLIITDIHMPIIDGKDFISNLKTNGIYSEIPIIVISSYKDEKTRRFCLEAGASECLIKPFNPEKLLKIIPNLISKPQEVSNR